MNQVEQMRDMCAKIAEDYDVDMVDSVPSLIAKAIRALPLQEIAEQEPHSLMDNRKRIMQLADAHGAELTGKPDGSEAITVVFSVKAWRSFSDALAPVQPSPCRICGETEANTGTCGGGRDKPNALCYEAEVGAELNPKDLRISTFNQRQSGFSIVVDRCVRLLHVPTGIEVTECEDRSVHKNRAVAMEKLQMLVNEYVPPVQPVAQATLIVDSFIKFLEEGGNFNNQTSLTEAFFKGGFRYGQQARQQEIDMLKKENRILKLRLKNQAATFKGEIGLAIGESVLSLKAENAALKVKLEAESLIATDYANRLYHWIGKYDELKAKLEPKVWKELSDEDLIKLWITELDKGLCVTSPEIILRASIAADRELNK